MVTDEEAVWIATELVRRTISKPWRFHSVHLTDPVDIVNKIASMTPHEKIQFLLLYRKEWTVLFDMVLGEDSDPDPYMEPGALAVTVDYETGVAEILEHVL